MSHQSLTDAPPRVHGAHQENENTFISDHDTFPLIEELLRQEQLSRHYQEQLESQVYAGSADYQRVRAYCLQLQRMASGVQQHKSQLEASLAYMSEACRVMARDLGLERAKVQELQSRLNELYPKTDSLLQKLANEEHKKEVLSDGGANGHLLLENQHQQELIISFQSTLLSRERTIQELKTTLGKTVQGLQSRERSQNELDQLNVEEAQDQDDDGSSEESCVEIITDKLSGGRF